MPRNDGQKRGYNEVGLLLIAGKNPADLADKINKLPPTSAYLQGGEMAIRDFQANPQNFALIAG
jgi:hypothetical protein